MMLELQKVMEMFSVVSDLSGEELGQWRGICRVAAARLERRLRADVDVQREMEPLCIAAAAIAYGDYLMLESARTDSDELQVGDIRIKSSAAGRRDAGEIVAYFLAEVAHLLEPDYPALFAVEEPV